MKDWFESWFNTPYYHILYKERNDAEAQSFIQNIVHHFEVSKQSNILDLACGKGRHAKFLNSLGFQVEGADLSSESIAEANKFSNEHLHFFVHDMRNELPKKYDLILNLFTSFGYFENQEENMKVVKAIKKGLKPNGRCIIDFLNLAHVKSNLVSDETKIVDDIPFQIQRKITNSHILKDIRFEVDKQTFHYTEKVQALTFNDFEEMMNEAGLQINCCYGNYLLKPYLPNQSERLILDISHKNNG